MAIGGRKGVEADRRYTTDNEPHCTEVKLVAESINKNYFILSQVMHCFIHFVFREINERKIIFKYQFYIYLPVMPGFGFPLSP